MTPDPSLFAEVGAVERQERKMTGSECKAGWEGACKDWAPKPDLWASTSFLDDLIAFVAFLLSLASIRVC